MLAQEALGYLHANCGMCHNDSVDGLPNSTLYMWLHHDDTTVEQTPTYLSAAGVPTVTFMNPACTHRLEPGDPCKAAWSSVWKAARWASPCRPSARKSSIPPAAPPSARGSILYRLSS